MRWSVTNPRSLPAKYRLNVVLIDLNYQCPSCHVGMHELKGKNRKVLVVGASGAIGWAAAKHSQPHMEACQSYAYPVLRAALPS